MTILFQQPHLPSTGGELASAEPPQPPRQIEPPIEPVGQSA